MIQNINENSEIKHQVQSLKFKKFFFLSIKILACHDKVLFLGFTKKTFNSREI